MISWQVLCIAGAAIVLVFGAAVLSGLGFPVERSYVDTILGLLIGGAGGYVVRGRMPVEMSEDDGESPGG